MISEKETVLLVTYEQLRIEPYLTVMRTGEEEMTMKRRKANRIDRTIVGLVGHCHRIFRLHRHIGQTLSAYRDNAHALDLCNVFNLRDCTVDREFSEPL